MKRVLLLTNADYDNVGDQMIEACDRALLQAAFENLGVLDETEIISRGVSLISTDYVKQQDARLLKEAEQAVKESDLLLFGGAPVFNYRYESFYEKTATWLSLAQKYDKPVIFSAIGVEHVEENNPKCQRIKQALHDANVVMVTTRDGLSQLEWYVEGLDLIAEKVADPAVYTKEIFTPYLAKEKEEKSVGIFILRANGFLDNGHDFTRDDAARLWLDVMEKCRENGYTPYLLTSGFAADEAFLDYMIRHYHVPKENCIFNVNTPEDLVYQISRMEAVISCRLHPGILSYSLGVPAVGIQWNPKVKMFYHEIGYEDRAIPMEGIDSALLWERLQEAMGDVAERDETRAWHTYETLVEGIRKALYPKNREAVWSREEFLERVRPYPGTTKEDYEKKLEAKFRRAYVTYNNAFQKGQKLQKQLDETKEKAKNSHEHALVLKEKNLRLQEKVTQLNARNVELKGKLKDARRELNEVYSQSLIETVRNWRKGKKEHEKQDS